MIYLILKVKVFSAFLFFLGEVAFKLGFSIILQFLFQSVVDGEKDKAYGLAFAGGMCWLFSQMSKHNAFYQAPIIGCRLRTGLVSLLFAKLSALSQYTIKNSEISKVVNMLSNDFNII